MITYNYYCNIKYYLLKDNIFGIDQALIKLVKTAEQQNPEWKYRIVKEYLDVLLWNKEPIA